MSLYSSLHDRYLTPPDPTEWQEREVEFEYECEALVVDKNGLEVSTCDFWGEVEGFISYDGELTVECPECRKKQTLLAEFYGFDPVPEYDEW